MSEDLHTFYHDAMNCPFEVMIHGHEEGYASSAANGLFHEIEQLEEALSRFVEYSDVSKLKVHPAGTPLRVTPETMNCLLVAVWACRETEGAFDVSLGKGLDELVLDPDGLTAAFKRECEPYELDLGGIGKGFALDFAAEYLAGWGINDALISAGGSTALALGMNGSDPWSLGVNEEPVDLKDVAISGSGKDIQGEHVMDPRSQKPAAGHEKAWVICPSAAVADALSTAFMVMNTGAVQRFCDEHKEVQALLINSDGEFLQF